MDTQDTSLLNSGQRVGLAVANYPKELADFPPLLAADTDRARFLGKLGMTCFLVDYGYLCATV